MGSTRPTTSLLGLGAWGLAGLQSLLGGVGHTACVQLGQQASGGEAPCSTWVPGALAVSSLQLHFRNLQGIFAPARHATTKCPALSCAPPAGYDNGDVKMFDLRTNTVRWDTNVGSGVCGVQVGAFRTLSGHFQGTVSGTGSPRLNGHRKARTLLDSMAQRKPCLGRTPG
jgi:hypothetical protein